MIHHALLPPPHPMQAPIPKAWPFLSQLPQTGTQDHFVPFSSLVPPTPAVHPDQPTGAPLAQLSFFASHPHGFSFCPRAYHFFDSTNLSASISSACWATIFFRRAYIAEPNPGEYFHVKEEPIIEWPRSSSVALGGHEIQSLIFFRLSHLGSRVSA